MQKDKINFKISVLVIVVISLFLIWETNPTLQSERRIKKAIVKRFPIGTDRKEIVDFANVKYKVPSYKSQVMYLDYIIGEINGVVVVTVTWEFNNKNKLINIEVQKDYGP